MKTYIAAFSGAYNAGHAVIVAESLEQAKALLAPQLPIRQMHYDDAGQPDRSPDDDPQITELDVSTPHCKVLEDGDN